jgi:uncharacterized protein YggE
MAMLFDSRHVLSVAAILMATASDAASEKPEQPRATISVAGEASVEAVPDRVEVVLGVATPARTATR